MHAEYTERSTAGIGLHLVDGYKEGKKDIIKKFMFDAAMQNS